MPVWHENMTAEDHERNLADHRAELWRDLKAAQQRVRQWQAEEKRLSGLIIRDTERLNSMSRRLRPI